MSSSEQSPGDDDQQTEEESKVDNEEEPSAPPPPSSSSMTAAADDASSSSPSYEDQARPYQKWTLSYLNPLLKLGASKVLDINDLGRPSEQDAADVVHGTVIEAWTEEIRRAEVATVRLREKDAEAEARKKKEEERRRASATTRKQRRFWGGGISGRRRSEADDGVGVELSMAAETAPEADGTTASSSDPPPPPPSEPRTVYPSLSRTLFRAFGPWRIVYSISLLYVSALLAFLPILLLNDLVRYFEALNAGLTHDGWAHPWVEVVGLGLVPLIVSLLQTRHMVIMQHCAIFVRTGCSTLLFRKALRVSPTGRARTSTGQIVNMMNVDTNVIMRFIQMVGMTVVTPLQIVISLVLIYRQVGNATWVGVGFMFLLVPFNGVIFGIVAKLRRRVLKHQDARVKMINDVLTGIRIIKFYAWEKPFLGEIGRVREEELKALTTLTLVMLVGFSAILFAFPILQIILVFMTYVLTAPEGSSLSASVAFTTVALFNMMRFPFAILPMGFLQWIQANIGIKRMSKYLGLPELTEYVIDGEDPDGGGGDREGTGGGAGGIIMNAGSFAWTDGGEESTKPLFEDVDAKKKKRERSSTSRSSSVRRRSSLFRRNQVDDPRNKSTSITNGESVAGEIESNASSGERFVLREISCNIPPGSLVAVVGPVGCGKSSFLNCVLGEMEALDGSRVYIPRGDKGKDAANFSAFCSQTPWVVNDTLRGNIVFGRPFDRDRYNAILEACALLDDIAILPAGEMSEIGERGVGLSGGQKARVCLARALYSSDTSLLLLDDPLSAVDAHVGEHLFNVAIAGELAAGTTRVLVTHHVQFLPRCDWVIVMEEGMIKHQGTYEGLVGEGVDFAGAINVPDEGSPSVESNSGKVDGVQSPVAAAKVVQKQASDIQSNSSKREKPVTSGSVADSGTSGGASSCKVRALMTEEGREQGSVAKKAYVDYIKAGGVILALLFIFAQGASKAFEIGSSFWLAKWADDTVAADFAKDPLTDSETIYYLSMYAMFGLLGVGCLIGRGYALAYHRLRSSRILHADMTASILRAPIAFFDVTPMGRILNRFSHDMDKIDLELGHVTSQAANVIFAVLGALGAMAAATKGVFLVIIPPVSCVYYKIQKWFRKSSTELQRIFSVTKSPIFADFSQVLSGVSVIRAYGEQDNRFNKLRGEFDKNNAAYFLQQLSFLWVSLRLDILGGIISLFVAAFAVGTTGTALSIPAGWLGLALTYSIEIVQYLKYGVRTIATMEADFSSVERVLEFAQDIEPEAPNEMSDDPSPGKWPVHGEITVSNISMRYRDGPLILNNLSFHVAGGEKIGVVGRTGSGKSSVMIALLRIVEIEKDGGKISIDGVDVHTLGTSALRSGISIIPQESVLFANSVRYNLDPFREKTDEEIWEALRKVRLAEVIAAMPAALETQVVEGGENFSQGQKQLLCIARPLLRKPRILIMDEATASIDNATDADIQEMIRDNFADATILTIAHRLNTIMDSDRILVLDEGRLAELNTPSALLENQDGIFASMVQQERESRRPSIA